MQIPTHTLFGLRGGSLRNEPKECVDPGLLTKGSWCLFTSNKKLINNYPLLGTTHIIINEMHPGRSLR